MIDCSLKEYGKKVDWMNNLLDVVGGPMDLAHNLELELVSPQDDETCRLHQTYSLQSSCRTGIQVDQASQEICSLWGLHTCLQEQDLVDKTEISHELQYLSHLAAGHYKTEQSLLFADSLVMIPAVPASLSISDHDGNAQCQIYSSLMQDAK